MTYKVRPKGQVVLPKALRARPRAGRAASMRDAEAPKLRTGLC